MKHKDNYKYIRAFWIIIFTCVVVTVFINAVTNGAVFEELFFADRLDTGMDFFNCIGYVQGRVPYTRYTSLYPPLANLLFFFLYHSVPVEYRESWTNAERYTLSDMRMQQSTAVLFILFTIVTIIICIILFYSIMNIKNEWDRLFVSIACLLTSCMLYNYERGNVIIIAFIFIAIFLQFYQSSNKFLAEIALIALAIAAGLKLYPALFGILLLKDKQICKSLRAILYGLLMFIVPFFFFEGIEGMKILIMKIFTYSDRCSSIDLGGIGLQDIFKTIFMILNIDHISGVKIISIISYIVVFIGIILAILIKCNWKSIALLSCACIILPGHTPAYGPIYFILPMLLFFLESKISSKKNLVYYFLFLLMFIVLPFPHIEYFKNLSPFSAYPFTLREAFLQIIVFLFYVYLFIDCTLSIFKPLKNKEFHYE